MCSDACSMGLGGVTTPRENPIGLPKLLTNPSVTEHRQQEGEEEEVSRKAASSSLRKTETERGVSTINWNISLTPQLEVNIKLFPSANIK